MPSEPPEDMTTCPHCLGKTVIEETDGFLDCPTCDTAGEISLEAAHVWQRTRTDYIQEDY